MRRDLDKIKGKQSKLKPDKFRTWEARKAESKIINSLLKPLQNQRGAVPVPEVTADIKGSFGRTTKLLDKYLGALSTRAENIDPSIKNLLIEFELDYNTKIEDLIRQTLPLIKATRKMSKADYKEFDFARKNADTETINKFLDKYNDIGLKKEYEKFRALDDVLIEQARNSGFKVNYLKEHNPREVKDFEGLMDHLYKTDQYSTVELFIRARERKLNRPLTRNERIELVNSIFRGYADERVTLSKPGQLKLRKLRKLTPEMAKFFGDSNSAMLRYISDVVSAIEARKIFGKGVNKDSDIYNLENTFGSYILNLAEQKKLSWSQELELRTILKARFAPVGTKGIVTTIKNLSVIDVMGSPASALRQVGDIAWALVENGIIPTVKVAPRAVVGKSWYTKESLGISKIGAEFSDKTTSAKAVDRVFRMIWLTKIDAIGKEILINSSYINAVARSRSKNPTVVAELMQELREFRSPKQAEELMMTLRNNGDSRDVRLYLLRKLSEYQPATLTELPEGFISGGNARLFYMLKSFDLKKFDVYRRKVFKQLKTKGKRASGIKNLIKIAFFLTLMEATGDMLIDLFLGRPVSFGRSFMNRLSHIAVSRYMSGRIGKEGLGTAIGEQILPPTQLVDSVTKDILSAGDKKGLETTKSIPFVGKWLYWRYGKGADKLKKQQEKEEKAAETNTLRKLRRSYMPTGKIERTERPKRNLRRSYMPKGKIERTKKPKRKLERKIKRPEE